MAGTLPEDRAQPTLGLRERKKQQTRRLIAETARRLFGERGFDRVTVAEIARAADVSEKTVFNYFPTKEDLVYWRLEAFEAELLQTIRDRAPGESVLAGFRRFLLAQRGLLGKHDPAAREELTALTRMITDSPALVRREGEVIAGYTDALAALIAQETGARAGDVRPRVAAHAMMGVHRAIIDYTRGRVLAGELGPRLGRDARAQAERALALLEEGLGDYAAKSDAPSG
jgi:AcrR family transcriptional regulator